MQPTLVLVGGFLGAGKTTLILAAAGRLRAQGRRVAVIANDQGAELVDTMAFAAESLPAEEIPGGCFCCRFSEFVRSASRLLEFDPELIFAEPVGSCTDLAATIIQPLRRFYGERFHVAPLTVLLDPERLPDPGDPDIEYLFRKQIAEADLVLLTKADLHPDPRAPEGIRAVPVSARSGEGVAEWLAEVLDSGEIAGSRLLDIDYGRYAEAEAALGWLNWRASVRLRRALSPAALIGPFMDRIDRDLSAEGIAIAHLKAFAQAPTGSLKASICRNGEEPSVDGALDASPALRHGVVLNLRARGAPELLAQIVRRAVSELPGRVEEHHFEAFRPAAPKPEHRFSEVV